MKMMPICPEGRDEMLDESTIELFRQYLKDVLSKKARKVATLSWFDN